MSDDGPFFGAPALTGFPLGRPRPSALHVDADLGAALAAGPAIEFRGDDNGFVVEELPAYLTSGAGEHLYLHLEKRGLSTPQVCRRLALAFGLHERDIGVAGQKDARGVTRQRLSVPARIVEPRLNEVEEATGARLLDAARHGNKLRLGHTHGNRFRCRLDGVDGAAARAIEARMTRLSRSGMPNWFGAQRFGHAARALRDGERFISLHKKAISRREQFWVSALQSALWNAWLASRVEEDTWVTALDGDVLMKRDTGAPFICTDPAHDGPRCEAGEVSPSGPMYGRAMRCAERDALTQESRSLDRLGVSLATMLAHPAFATGTRRPSRVFAGEMKSHLDGAQLTVTFTLGPGSYASVFLEELVGARLVDRFFSDAAAGPDDA